MELMYHIIPKNEKVDGFLNRKYRKVSVQNIEKHKVKLKLVFGGEGNGVLYNIKKFQKIRFIVNLSYL